MTTPRYQLVDNTTPLFYHLVSKCVRGSRLCGRDRHSKRDYSHRKRWLVGRLQQLAQAFALEVHAYAIMSNHFHLVVYFNPAAAQTWSNDEVVDRWLLACSSKSLGGGSDGGERQRLRASWLADSRRVSKMRAHLSSLSMFMKQLKQPIARRANIEDGCKGHFFEQRFYSGALLTEEAVLAAMAYVDLNPVRARLARSIKAIKHASISRRLENVENSAQRLNELLGPVFSGLDGADSRTIGTTLGAYLRQLELAAWPKRVLKASDSVRRWIEQVALLKHRQRVFGSMEKIELWVRARHWQLRERPLP